MITNITRWNFVTCSVLTLGKVTPSSRARSQKYNPKNNKQKNSNNNDNNNQSEPIKLCNLFSEKLPPLPDPDHGITQGWLGIESQTVDERHALNQKHHFYNGRLEIRSDDSEMMKSWRKRWHCAMCIIIMVVKIVVIIQCKRLAREVNIGAF